MNFRKAPPPSFASSIQKRAAASNIQKIDIDEKTFRWLMNEDAMATKKPPKASATSMRDAMRW